MELNFEEYRDSDAMTREEGELLYALVRATKPKLVAETGTHKGLSTRYMARACRDNGFGTVHTCDPLKLTEFEEPEIFFYQTEGVNLPVADVDFLLIDGKHGKQDVLDEIEALFPKLNPEATVVFHDCDDNEISNTEMVNAALFAKGLKTVYLPTKNRMRIYNAKD